MVIVGAAGPGIVQRTATGTGVLDEGVAALHSVSSPHRMSGLQWRAPAPPGIPAWTRSPRQTTVIAARRTIDNACRARGRRTDIGARIPCARTRRKRDAAGTGWQHDRRETRRAGARGRGRSGA